MSKRLFDKQTKEVIYRNMDEVGGEITQEDVVDIIRPFLEAEFDIEKLKNQYSCRIANGLMSRFKDDRGKRTCFSVQGDDGSKYVNVDKTHNANDLISINTSLSEKINGLISSRKKVNKNMKRLNGQTKIEGIASDK